MTDTYYAIVVAQLRPEDGTGYIALVPDLYGCMSDGETPEEALTNAQQAIQEWIETAKEIGRPIPEPGTSAKKAAEARARLVQQLNEQRKAFEQLDAEIKSLRAQIETATERLESDPVDWTPDSAMLAVLAKQSQKEDMFH
jgi:antitoxin HicB